MTDNQVNITSKHIVDKDYLHSLVGRYVLTMKNTLFSLIFVIKNNRTNILHGGEKFPFFHIAIFDRFFIILIRPLYHLILTVFFVSCSPYRPLVPYYADEGEINEDFELKQ